MSWTALICLTLGCSRFPAALEVRSNWPALVKLRAPEPLVAAAARLDQLRMAGDDGLVWSPQFRDVESIVEMTRRVGERAAIGFFVSDLHEQVTAGKIQAAEAAAACRMLDEAGYGHLRVGASSKLPNLNGAAAPTSRGKLDPRREPPLRWGSEHSATWLAPLASFGPVDRGPRACCAHPGRLLHRQSPTGQPAPAGAPDRG